MHRTGTTEKDSDAQVNAVDFVMANSAFDVRSEALEITCGGNAPGEEISNEGFREQFEARSEELESLNAEARELETTTAANVAEILEA